MGKVTSEILKKLLIVIYSHEFPRYLDGHNLTIMNDRLRTFLTDSFIFEKFFVSIVNNAEKAYNEIVQVHPTPPEISELSHFRGAVAWTFNF
jgi:hypothetical protein